MRKRLQVLFDCERAAIQRLAKSQRKTPSAWVGDALRAAPDCERNPDAEPTLRAVREALSYAYPTGDIEEVLGDIERGYAGRSEGG